MYLQNVNEVPGRSLPFISQYRVDPYESFHRGHRDAKMIEVSAAAQLSSWLEGAFLSWVISSALGYCRWIEMENY